MSSSTWQEHFKDRLEGLTASGGGSLLELALREGRVPEAEYLTWASQSQLIPLLDSKFFAEQTPDAELMKRVNHPWRPTIFPVAEWDGHLIVACLEVPASLQNPNISFVLAAPSAMVNWWNLLSPNEEVPEGLSAQAIPDGLLNENQSPQAPAMTVNLSFSGVGLAKPLATEPAPPENAVETAATTPSPVTSAPVETTAPVAAKESLPPVQKFVRASAQPAPTPNPPEDPTSTKTLLPVTESPLPPLPSQLKTLSNPTPDRHRLAAVAINRKDFTGEAREALRQLSGCFPKTMLLALDETMNHLIPILWSESFGQPTPPGRVDLSTPSLFRIVMTTEKPYHGYIVPSDVNDEFIRAWNGGESPKNMTLIPLVFRDRIVGALLGLGAWENTNFAVLRHAEKVGLEFMRKVGGRVESSAA